MDIFHADAQLVVAALSDAQLLRAFGHADRTRAVAELAQARRSEAAAPSPDAVREAEARQLQAVLAAVVGRAGRRCRFLRRMTMTLIGLWAASGVAVAIGFWIDHRTPGTSQTLSAATLIVSFCILLAAAVNRIIELRAADRYRASVVETVLEWAGSQPGRLGRGADGLPLFRGAFGAADWKLYFGAGFLCLIPAFLVPLVLFGDGWTAAGFISIPVVSIPLIVCAVAVWRGYSRMERRLDRTCELIAALSNPSPAARMQMGDLRFFSPAASGVTHRGAPQPTKHNGRGVR